MQPQIGHRIIVPIDFSQHSSVAVQWAAYWQRQTGADVTVLHSMQFEAPPAIDPEQIEQLLRKFKRSHTQVLDEIRAFVHEHAGGEMDWQFELAEGDPVPHILQQASGADLVIMGTHGRRGVRRWMLGSVAEAMIHAHALPTLVVHAGQQAHLPVRRMLVADNHGEAGEAGLRFARTLSGVLAAELVALHVVEAHDTHPAQSAFQGVQLITRAGRPAEQILAAAGEVMADLVVLATGRQRFLEMDILPATVTQVVRYSTVPVLVMPLHRAGGIE